MDSEPTDKQERFAQEYLIDLNGAAAARRAGYAEKNARAQAVRLLTNANVQRRINVLKQEQASRLEITADTVLYDLETLCAGAIEAGQYGPAIRAKELQGKHLALFVDRFSHEKDGPIDLAKIEADIRAEYADDPELRDKLLSRIRRFPSEIEQTKH